MSRLILPPGSRIPDPDVNEWPVWESYECQGMGVALSIADKVIKDTEEAGEDVTEMKEARDELVDACNQECSSSANGCAIKRTMETSVGLYLPNTPSRKIFSTVADIIAQNAAANDGLIGVLGKDELYLQDVVKDHLKTVNARMVEAGLEPVTLTDGAWQKLSQEFRGNFRVAINAVKDLTNVMAEIQSKGLLLGHTAEIAGMLENPPKTIYKADIENLFNNKDFARWVDLACTPKDKIFKP